MSQALIVTDLGFGDSGKGGVVDHYCRTHKVSVVVRHNGGNQAAHNVLTPDGKHHTFSQFGSGSFSPGVRTHLSRFMLVDPIALLREARHLAEVSQIDPLSGLSVDREAIIITPFHRYANRIRERARSGNAHGSCGLGIGEAAMNATDPALTIRMKDVNDPKGLLWKMRAIQEHKRSELASEIDKELAFGDGGSDADMLTDRKSADFFANEYLDVMSQIYSVPGEYLKTLLMADDGDVVFEGAQGVLLDEDFGFHPHTTWSHCTPVNAQTLLAEIGYQKPIHKLGVLRAYLTRHGAGPFPTEDVLLTKALPDAHNGNDGHQGTFRCGWFDMILAKYAMRACRGIDSLAITHLDRLEGLQERWWCHEYSHQNHAVRTISPVLFDDPAAQLTRQTQLTAMLCDATPILAPTPVRMEDFVGLLEYELATKISLVSHGPTANDKIARTPIAV